MPANELPCQSFHERRHKRSSRAPAPPSCRFSRQEMDALGWDSCDIIMVTGDAYVDHPSFGMAVIGRMLEAQGFRVGIIAQPDWQSAGPVPGARQAEPVLRRHRRQHGFDDQPLHGRTARCAPTTPTRPAASAAQRPDRAAIVYSQRCKEAWSDVPVVIGGIEGLAAPHRALRLLAGQGAPLDRGRLEGRPAALRQRRARDRRDRAPPGRARADRRRSPTCAAPPSCAAGRRPRTGSRSIRPASTRPADALEAHVNPYLMEAEQIKATDARPAPRKTRRSRWPPGPPSEAAAALGQPGDQAAQDLRAQSGAAKPRRQGAAARPPR